jgi:hypothetical protein
VNKVKAVLRYILLLDSAPTYGKFYIRNDTAKWPQCRKNMSSKRSHKLLHSALKANYNYIANEANKRNVWGTFIWNELMPTVRFLKKSASRDTLMRPPSTSLNSLVTCFPTDCTISPSV